MAVWIDRSPTEFLGHSLMPLDHLDLLSVIRKILEILSFFCFWILANLPLKEHVQS